MDAGKKTLIFVDNYLTLLTLSIIIIMCNSVRVIWLQCFLLRYFCSIGKSGRKNEHGKSVKVHITSISPVLQDCLTFLLVKLIFILVILVEVKLRGI